MMSLSIISKGPTTQVYHGLDETKGHGGHRSLADLTKFRNEQRPKNVPKRLFSVGFGQIFALVTSFLAVDELIEIWYSTSGVDINPISGRKKESAGLSRGPS
jgi:hypothetical protein